MVLGRFVGTLAQNGNGNMVSQLFQISQLHLRYTGMRMRVAYSSKEIHLGMSLIFTRYQE
jgi:hypothetical protein